MILEIGKSYVKKYYNGNLKKAIADRDGHIWTEKDINLYGKKLFADYMANNKQYAYFVTI